MSDLWILWQRSLQRCSQCFAVHWNKSGPRWCCCLCLQCSPRPGGTEHWASPWCCTAQFLFGCVIHRPKQIGLEGFCLCRWWHCRQATCFCFQFAQRIGRMKRETFCLSRVLRLELISVPARQTCDADESLTHSATDRQSNLFSAEVGELQSKVLRTLCKKLCPCLLLHCS